MSEAGVIPPPEERARALEVGQMKDVDGLPIVFSLNLDGTVRIEIGRAEGIYGYANADLDSVEREEFSRLYFEAVRRAEEHGTSYD